MGNSMAGYFKTTKEFYRALWAWLEIQKYTNLMPMDCFGNVARADAYIRYESEALLGYVRGWPEMPELGAGHELFERAKALARTNTPQAMSECRKTLTELKNFMDKKGMR
jgi:hypothetical protein